MVYIHRFHIFSDGLSRASAAGLWLGHRETSGFQHHLVVGSSGKPESYDRLQVLQSYEQQVAVPYPRQGWGASWPWITTVPVYVIIRYVLQLRTSDAISPAQPRPLTSPRTSDKLIFWEKWKVVKPQVLQSGRINSCLGNINCLIPAVSSLRICKPVFGSAMWPWRVGLSPWPKRKQWLSWPTTTSTPLLHQRGLFLSQGERSPRGRREFFSQENSNGGGTSSQSGFF